MTRKPIMKLPTIEEQWNKVNAALEETEKALINRYITWEAREWNDSGTECFLEDHSGVIIKLDYYFVHILENDVLIRLDYNTLSCWTEEDELCRIIHRRTEALKKKVILEDETEYDIYVLFDRRGNFTVRYVGISYDVETRYKQHIGLRGGNKELNAWIQEIQQHGRQPGITVIETVKGIAYARIREQQCIHAYLNVGTPLTNRDHVGYVESAS